MSEARKKVFQYVAVYHPTKQESDKDGKKTQLISGDDPKTIVAGDEQQAALLVGRKLPEEYLDKLDRVEILIRPF